MTIKSQLIAKECDLLGYITYVFKCLECNIPFGHNYIMCTRCPNWETRDIDIGEKGYLEYKEVIAGEKWYDSKNNEYVPYKYTNIYFIKFVKEEDNLKKDIII